MALGIQRCRHRPAWSAGCAARELRADGLGDWTGQRHARRLQAPGAGVGTYRTPKKKNAACVGHPPLAILAERAFLWLGSRSANQMQDAKSKKRCNQRDGSHRPGSPRLRRSWPLRSHPGSAPTTPVTSVDGRLDQFSNTLAPDIDTLQSLRMSTTTHWLCPTRRRRSSSSSGP
jgi:hypothetical protein